MPYYTTTERKGLEIAFENFRLRASSRRTTTRQGDSFYFPNGKSCTAVGLALQPWKRLRLETGKQIERCRKLWQLDFLSFHHGFFDLLNSVKPFFLEDFSPNALILLGSLNHHIDNIILLFCKNEITTRQEVLKYKKSALALQIMSS